MVTMIRRVDWNTVAELLENESVCEEVIAHLSSMYDINIVSPPWEDIDKARHLAFTKLLSLRLNDMFRHNPKLIENMVSLPAAYQDLTTDESIHALNCRLTIAIECLKAPVMFADQDKSPFFQEIGKLKKIFNDSPNPFNHIGPLISEIESFLDEDGFRKMLNEIYKEQQGDTINLVHNLYALMLTNNDDLHLMVRDALNDHFETKYGFTLTVDDMLCGSTWRNGSQELYREARFRDSQPFNPLIFEKMTSAERRQHLSLLQQNLFSMNLIENEVPGGVKLLWEKYHIRDFCRYPNEILVAQAKNEGNDVPYGVLICPRDDHSLSLLEDFSALRELYESMGGRHIVRIFEEGASSQVARDLITLDKQYGSQEKISFVIVNGHGNREGVTLEAPYEGTYASNEQFEKMYAYGQLARSSLAQASRSTKQKMQAMFKPNAPILVLACMTGQPQGFSQELSNFLATKVVSVKNLGTAIKHFKAVYDADGVIDFDIEFDDEKSKVSYVQGKVQK